jgi:serine/threonine protein kinase
MTAELGQAGQIIDGKYRIVRLLGTGGMGAVFEGENIRIRRRVAIKMLHGSVSSQPDVIARFEREAQAAALVGSEHICEVLDLGMLPDETRYMVMEYLEGETLSGLIERHGRLTPAQSIPIVTQILDGLGAAHAAGIVHRDLKPDNVFILTQKGGVPGFVKILDFGVSKFSQLGGEVMNVTRAGSVVGTPYYMSPEQARGSSAIDQRTDIYAIGVLLYQATTGQVPYQADTFNELLFKIVLEVAPPPQTYVPDLDPAFAAIIQRAMNREPDQRFQTCQQFRDALVERAAQLQAPWGNPLPQGARPGFRHAPASVRTEVLDMSKLPGNPAAPPPPMDGTVAMQPGLYLGGNTGAGGAPSPLHSGASWATASSPSNPVALAGSANTANSWGNASSSSNAPLKPRSKGLLVGVVAVVALAGVGAAFAFVALGKSHEPSKPLVNQPAATVTVTAVTATATEEPAKLPASAAAPSAIAETQAEASSSATSASPSATASATSAKSALVGRGQGPMPTGGAAPGRMGAAANKGSKPIPKGGGNDLGY